jgi:uncharacterized protein (UPF0335 family)
MDKRFYDLIKEIVKNETSKLKARIEKLEAEIADIKDNGSKWK